MLRVVIDTSSLVSYALTRGELMRQIIAYWRAGTITVLSSSSTRAELSGVLARPVIRQRVVAPLDELVRGLERFSEHVRGDMELSGACRDSKDDKFLSCAIQGKAHYLISSDRDLLEMRHYGGVAIVNPGQFLLALELRSADANALAGRFSHGTLADIQRTIPLDPVARDRIARAIELLGDQN